MKSLRRITSGGKYVPEIDGLRFIAILSVVIFHTFGQILSTNGFLAPVWIDTLRRGVELFFVISGFVLGLPFAKHAISNGNPVSLGSYFLRRITRLEPPYIAILVLCAAMFIVSTRDLSYVLHHFGWSLAYLHGIRYGHVSTISTVAWSLEVEVQFYLIAPLLALGFRIRPTWLRRSLFAVLIVTSSLIQVHTIADGSRAWLSLLNWISFFVAGFLLADIYTLEWQKISHSSMWDVASLISLIAIFGLSSKTAHILISPLSLIVYIAAFKGKLMNLFCRKEWVAIIGGMCYSIYLTHALVLSAIRFITTRFQLISIYHPLKSVVIAYSLAFPAVFVFGTAYFIAIERPCMARDWPQRLWSFVTNQSSKPA